MLGSTDLWSSCPHRFQSPDPRIRPMSLAADTSLVRWWCLLRLHVSLLLLCPRCHPLTPMPLAGTQILALPNTFCTRRKVQSCGRRAWRNSDHLQKSIKHGFKKKFSQQFYLFFSDGKKWSMFTVDISTIQKSTKKKVEMTAESTVPFC